MASHGGTGSPLIYHAPIHVHAARNQAEYGNKPSRYAPMADAIRRFRRALNYGIVTLIPYHHKSTGDLGLMKAWSYAVPPVVNIKGYRGETFLRMMPRYPLRHPSGLADETLLHPSSLTSKG